MLQQSFAALVGLLVIVSPGERKEPKVVGDPTGVYRRTLEDTEWVQGDPKAPDRREILFGWQEPINMQDDNKCLKRPAITAVFYREGKVVRCTYGPFVLEKSGKCLLKSGDRLYRYRLNGKTIRFEQDIPPFEFEMRIAPS